MFIGEAPNTHHSTPAFLFSFCLLYLFSSSCSVLNMYDKFWLMGRGSSSSTKKCEKKPKTYILYMYLLKLMFFVLKRWFIVVYGSISRCKDLVQSHEVTFILQYTVNDLPSEAEASSPTIHGKSCMEWLILAVKWTTGFISTGKLTPEQAKALQCYWAIRLTSRRLCYSRKAKSSQDSCSHFCPVTLVQSKPGKKQAFLPLDPLKVLSWH